MTRPFLLAFCASGDRERVLQAANCIPLYALFTDAAHAMAREVPRPLILLAIGPEGGVELARWIEAHGLDGVAGIGLVGVTAPWAERRSAVTQTLEEADAGKGAPFQLPLGPLEPLRAVAERARLCAPLCPCCRSERVRPDTDDCKHFICRCGHAFTPTPLRIVIACAPDDGVCSTCGGSGEERIEPPYVLEPEIRDCSTCGGTGKALSSANVALELSGGRALYDGIDDFQATTGGLTVIHYRTRGDLDKQGIRAVIENLTQ